MKRYSWCDDNSIVSMGKLLQQGGVVVGSSDTVFGLLVPMTNKGRARLDAIKGRQNKPYLVLAASIEDVKKLVDPVKVLQVEKLLKKCWPGPLTVIFKPSVFAQSFSSAFTQEPTSTWTIALRVPKHEGLQKLLALTGPLFSTSANRTGQPVPATLDQIDPAILKQVDGIVMDADEQSSTLSTPSTIIDVTGDTLVMVREGAYSKIELERLVEKV